MGTISGWLLVYLIGSVPLVFFYSAGLSGWFFDYPVGLFIGILVVLVVPLVLLVFKVPSAPAWNTALLWIGAGLITLRMLYGLIRMKRALQRAEGLSLAAIVFVALAWALVWTRYFFVSEKIAKIFA